jgi:2-dehydro-3-deoxy-D-arabinonate dehydratase
MKLCRFQNRQGQACVGLVLEDGAMIDLTAGGVATMASLLEADDLVSQLTRLADQNLPRLSPQDVRLLSPVERQEVWAVGVTYLRSKKARMEESDFSATAYDRVYDAPRPELFFKCLPEKVVAAGDAVGIRKDASWNVPEPELALVINSRGRLIGYTIGNDMSARDIEGENLLYLPQAKIYDRSCAIGPCIVVGADEATARSWSIQLQIQRAETEAFQGQTSVGQIKRTFDELVSYLLRSQTFPSGAVLLTGTGIVPPDGFTLRSGDHIRISISGIGMLANQVVEV